MAFYTTRVDHNGNEIEHRHSARSLAISLSPSTTSTNTSCISMSSRSCETKGSVRYINPAAFIEKTPDQSETSSINEENKMQPPSGNQSDIVPPLDLQSEDNYPTTCDYTFCCREASKADLAYERWLSAKRKLISDEAARRRKFEEQKRKEQETRKRLSEEKVQQWLKTKSRQTLSHEKVKLQIDQEEKPSKPQIREEVQAKLEAWEHAKQLEDECRRALKREEDERRRLMKEQRQQMAAEAWKNWLAEVDKKPRPVPLNRGIFTLRGTISDIFVNPNEWQSTIPIDKD